MAGSSQPDFNDLSRRELKKHDRQVIPISKNLVATKTANYKGRFKSKLNPSLSSLGENFVQAAETVVSKATKDKSKPSLTVRAFGLFAVAALGSTVVLPAILSSDDPYGYAASVSSVANAESVKVLAIADTSKIQLQTDVASSRDSYKSSNTWDDFLAQWNRTSKVWTSNPDAPIQWPFPYTVRISSPFGPRVAPCYGCGSFHNGADFDAGNATPINAIADGTVIVATSSAWGLGVHIKILHDIDGQAVTSTYAHMISGSMTVGVGDKVSAGQPIGLVGNTGASTGPHLHLEIRIDGVPLDPIGWLQNHAG